MRRPVDIEIMGQRLTVTSEDGEEHVRQVADYLERRIQQLHSRGRSTGGLNLVLLAALNIASEYWKLQSELEEYEETINRLSARVLARVGR